MTSTSPSFPARIVSIVLNRISAVSSPTWTAQNGRVLCTMLPTARTVGKGAAIRPWLAKRRSLFAVCLDLAIFTSLHGLLFVKVQCVLFFLLFGSTDFDQKTLPKTKSETNTCICDPSGDGPLNLLCFTTTKVLNLTSVKPSPTKLYVQIRWVFNVKIQLIGLLLIKNRHKSNADTL